MTSREELLEQIRRKRALARIKQAQEEARAALPEQSTMDKARGVMASLQQGQLLGFEDEIVGAGRAVADKLLPNQQYDFGDNMVDESTVDRPSAYEMYRDDQRATRKEFAERNPKTAMGLELTGGLLTPGLGPVTGGGGSGLSRAAMALDDIGRGGGRAAAGQAVARGGAEGAIAGLGASEGESLEDMAWDAAGGAGWGAGTTIGLRAAGKAAHGLAKKKIAEDLVDETGRRTPLHLTDSGVGGLYRTLGRTPGARGQLQNLEAPFVEDAAEALSDAELDFRVTRDHISDTARAQKQAVDRQFEAASDQLEVEAPLMREAAQVRGAALADSRNARFQRRAAMESIPPHARDSLADVNLDNGRQTADAIAEWWTENGFEEVKKRFFDFDDRLGNMIKDRISNDPDLRLALGDIMPQLQAMQGRLTDEVIPGADLVPEDYIDELLAGKFQISGDALMAMRNVFATGANGNSKKGGSLRQVARVFDDFIREQLPAEEVAMFDETLQRYTTALTYQDVMRKKAVRKRGGNFTADEWMSTAERYGGRGMSTRRPPLDVPARVTARAADEARAQGAQDSRTVASEAAGLKKSARRAASREKAGIDQEAREARRVNEERKRTGDVAEARARAQELARRTLPENTTILSDLLTAEVTGSALPSPEAIRRNRALNVARGYGVGRAIGSEGFQDFLAGQTEWQQKLAQALRDGDMVTATRIMARERARESQEQ